MSWECYCAQFGCDHHPAETCANPGNKASLECGLRVDELSAPQRSLVFDVTGKQVGGSVHSDTSEYVCPDDSSLHALTARAGTFPYAGCREQRCDCSDGGVSPSCYATRSVDAGQPLPSCDCTAGTMSWDCYCAVNDCRIAPALTCSSDPSSDYHLSAIACGLRADSYGGPGGFSQRFFDENDALVGVDVAFDIPLPACPDDLSLVATHWRAGVQPDAGCSQRSCGCANGNVAAGCTVDAGLPPCGCSVTGGVLSMSWECYCATHDCNATPALTCPSYRESSVACGFRLDTSNPAGGPNTWVFNGDELVGVSLGSDTVSFECPDNSALHATRLSAGVLPDAGCLENSCSCADGGVVCP